MATSWKVEDKFRSKFVIQLNVFGILVYTFIGNMYVPSDNVINDVKSLNIGKVKQMLSVEAQ